MTYHPPLGSRKPVPPPYTSTPPDQASDAEPSELEKRVVEAQSPLAAIPMHAHMRTEKKPDGSVVYVATRPYSCD